MRLSIQSIKSFIRTFYAHINNIVEMKETLQHTTYEPFPRAIHSNPTKQAYYVLCVLVLFRNSHIYSYASTLQLSRISSSNGNVQTTAIVVTNIDSGSIVISERQMFVFFFFTQNDHRTLVLHYIYDIAVVGNRTNRYLCVYYMWMLFEKDDKEIKKKQIVHLMANRKTKIMHLFYRYKRKYITLYCHLYITTIQHTHTHTLMEEKSHLRVTVPL